MADRLPFNQVPGMRTLSILSLVACFFATASCNKDKDADLTATATTLAGTWSITAFTESTEGEADKDLLQTWDNCLTDNVYVMKEDKTYMQKDLGTLCATNGNNYVGVWMLDGNMLSFDKFTGDIEKLNTHQLIVTYKYPMMGVMNTRRAVFTKR
jgi:lipocalin-like protein